jgi:hypothetical protein
MNTTYLSFILLAFSMLFSNIISAQTGDVMIKGRVVENSGQQPIEFATVMIADKATKSAVAGGTTDLDVKFSLQ